MHLRSLQRTTRFIGRRTAARIVPSGSRSPASIASWIGLDAQARLPATTSQPSTGATGNLADVVRGSFDARNERRRAADDAAGRRLSLLLGRRRLELRNGAREHARR